MGMRGPAGIPGGIQGKFARINCNWILIVLT